MGITCCYTRKSKNKGFMFLYLKNKYPLDMKDLHNQVLRFRMETRNKFNNLEVCCQWFQQNLTLNYIINNIFLYNFLYGLTSFSQLSQRTLFEVFSKAQLWASSWHCNMTLPLSGVVIMISLFFYIYLLRFRKTQCWHIIHREGL